MDEMSVSRWMVLVGVAACGSSGNDMLPVGGGGGGGGGPGSGAIDAAVTHDAPRDGTPSSIDAALIHGRVCLVTSDPRHLGLDPATDCATTGAGGLTVRLDTKTTTTNPDGTFTIDGSNAKSGQIWSVTGAGIVSSYMVFSDYQIPALTTALFQSLTSANSVILLPGQGSVIAQLVHNGAGASGMIALTTPTSAYDAFYDGASATTFVQSTTGSAGVVWLPGIDVGSATVTAGPPPFPNQNEITTPTQPIVDGAITFVTITFP